MDSPAEDQTIALVGFEVSTPVRGPRPLLDVLRRLVCKDGPVDTEAVLAVSAEAEAVRDYPVALLASLIGARASYELAALESARNLALSALQLARETGNVFAEAHAYRLLALIAFDEGRSKDGHDHLLDAMASFEEVGRPKELPTLTRWYAEHLAVLGAKEEAETAFRLARDRFLAVGDNEGARLCELDLAALSKRR